MIFFEIIAKESSTNRLMTSCGCRTDGRGGNSFLFFLASRKKTQRGSRYRQIARVGAGVGRVQARGGALGAGVEDLLEGVQDDDAVGEDAVRQHERVEEVDRQEAQVGQPLQQPLGRRVADLRYLPT